jgi:hypothetical protein
MSVPPFRIQYVSNLFISRLNKMSQPIEFKPNAPILALLGNIGQPQCKKTATFLKWADKNYEQVFWIPGPLEYSLNSSLNWRQTADLCYSSIKDWNLKHTTFCQKFETPIQTYNINLIATPGWHLTFGKQENLNIFDWNYLGKNIPMEPKHFVLLQHNELDWILKKSDHSPYRNILLTHSPIPTDLLRNKNIACHLYGTEYVDKKSYSGGSDPWCGLNMANALGYKKDAFIELV